MTAAETEAPGMTGGGLGAAPNHPEDLEPRRSIPRRGSQTVALEVVIETSLAPAIPGSRPGDLAQDQDPK